MKNTGILFLFVVSLFLLSLVIYWPSFSAPFALDDYGVFVNNPLLHQTDHLDWIWQYDPSRFLTHVSFALNIRWGSFAPEWFHLVNYWLHMINTFLVFVFYMLLLGQLKEKRVIDLRVGWTALLASIFFMVHPLQTSTVTYIAQRATLLAALCYLGAMLFYLLGRMRQKLVFICLSLLFMFLGIFCKPVLVTLPLALLVIELGVFGLAGFWKEKRWLRLLPYGLIAALVPVLLSLWHLHSVKIADIFHMTRLTDAISRGDYLLTQFNVLVMYLSLFFLPLRQNLDYDFPLSTNLFEWPTLFSFILILAIAFLAVRFYARHRVGTFGVFFFFAALSLESSIFPLPDLIFEHRTYIPLIGLSLLLAYVIEAGSVSTTAKRWIALLLVVFFSLMGLQRNIIWGQKFALLHDVAAKSPNKSRVHNSLGLAYAEEGMFAEAIEAFTTAIHKDVRNIKAYNNRATVYRMIGKYDQALADYDRVMVMDPDFEMALFFRSKTHAAKGNTAQALQDAQRAAQLGFPVDPNYINNLINKNR